ncbi:MAG TPA: hypothetical protein VMV46_10010 [Thermoanaerobaculia bacterium]|nr:hypothetical protein [Thermoanaerobaculia bacterium]
MLLLAPGGLVGQTLQAGDPEAPAFATVRDHSSVRVELPGRRLVEVALGDGVELGSLAASGDRWLLAATRLGVDGRRRLVLASGDDDTWREIPGPLVQHATVRSEPVLLGGADAPLLGADLAVAWLEGDGSQRQSVRVARLRDGVFAEPETVAAAGPGSQVALRGAELLDGTWLLVWNAFDGEDNEIVWSWNRGGEWSAPARVGGDNRVPDVAPAVVAFGTGALVAWSRYDGRDYRLHLARLDHGEWSEPRAIGGPGSSSPSFLGDEARSLLLWTEASPRRWTVAELAEGDNGLVLPARSATARTPLDETPVVVLSADGGASLRWPPSAQRRRASALPLRWSQPSPPRAPEGAR